ncbi:MAG: TonB-dependent receptor plug domain-containing protein [Ferruginibacter sp.]|nr:TonB-dependent receptor plug domain-containing protein [Chitinophagaceae bacterium]
MKKLILFSLILISSIAAFSQKRLPQLRSAEQRLNDEYCTGMFSTIDGTYFDMLNDNATVSATGYLNILDWLQGRVAGLQIYTTRNNNRVPFIRNSRAGIYVDEVWYDPAFLNSLPVSDIAMIKIIKGPFAGGFNSPGGVIAIYTIRGEDEGEE